MLATAGAMALMAAVALASSVGVSVVDTTAPTGSVTLAPGGTGAIQINLSVTGNQDGTATFKVNRTWTLSSAGTWTGSDPQTFTVDNRTAQDPADVFSTTGSVVIASGAPAGTRTLSVGVFDITNSNQNGGKLSAGTAGSYSVTVDSTPPGDTQAPAVSAVSIDSGADWTRSATGGVSVSFSATDNVGIVSYKLAESAAALAGATSTAVSPAATSISPSGISFTLTGSEAASKSVFAQACDAAGNCTAASDLIGWDKTLPDISRDVSADSCDVPGLNGWCRGTQTAGFSASDLLSGLLGTQPASFTRSTSDNGGAVYIGSGSVSDVAGNENTGINAGPFKIDSVAPTSSVSGFTAGQTFTRGSDPAAGCLASDATSGVDGHGTPTSDRTGLNANGVGSVSVTCNGATDNAGNQQTVASSALSYTLQHLITGAIADPINPDGSSIFNQKRAVPVKFALGGDESDANNDGIRDGFNIAGWKVERSKPVSCPGGTAWEAEALADTTSSSTGLRYDPVADQYIANATLSGTTVGHCHRFIVTLDNGQTIQSPTFKVGK